MINSACSITKMYWVLRKQDFANKQSNKAKISCILALCSASPRGNYRVSSSKHVFLTCSLSKMSPFAAIIGNHILKQGPCISSSFAKLAWFVEFACLKRLESRWDLRVRCAARRQRLSHGW